MTELYLLGIVLIFCLLNVNMVLYFAVQSMRDKRKLIKE